MELVKYDKNSIIPKEGTIGLMCPKCFNTVNIDIYGHYNFSIMNESKFDRLNNEIIPLMFDLQVYKQCNECLEDMVEIDANIIEPIVEFNKLGWKTRFCCGGHYPYNYDSYILFIMIKNTRENYFISNLKDVIDHLNLEELKLYTYNIDIQDTIIEDLDISKILLRFTISNEDKEKHTDMYFHMHTIYTAIVNEFKKKNICNK